MSRPREAISDARDHEGTTRLEVDIREHRGAVHGRVWDNGSGRAAERVRLVDGDVQIRSVPGRGTLVAFRLPLEDAGAIALAAAR